MLRRVAAVACSVTLTTTSCAFGGANSLPLPGAVASGSDNAVYHVHIANVGTLTSNSPVMIADTVVGSVGDIGVEDWHAVVDVRVKRDVVVPANAIAKIGQTSLLGSMHLALDPPVGEPPTGQLAPGSTIDLNRSSTYPSTEQTLSSLSVVTNAGGLGQVGDFVHSTAIALGGRESDIRQLISRLDDFVGTVDSQRDHFVAAVHALDRLTGTLADEKNDITDALRTIPPALDVLLKERSQLVTALQKLGQFSDVTTELVNGVQDDLVRNLTNLDPTLKALADIGPQLDTVLAYLPTFPLSQNLIDRGVRGDYINIFASMDLTIPRLKRSLLAGTRWGDPNATLTPAPGDPQNLIYSVNPLGGPVAAPPPAGGPGTAPVPAANPIDQAVLPIAPPPSPEPPPAGPGPVFAGPYSPPPSPAPGGN